MGLLQPKPFMKGNEPLGPRNYKPWYWCLKDSTLTFFVWAFLAVSLLIIGYIIYDTLTMGNPYTVDPNPPHNIIRKR